MRNAEIFVNFRLSDIPDNLDIEQSKTSNELNRILIFFIE